MNNSQPGPQAQQFNVDVSQIEAMKCACGNNIFIPFSQLKFISAFYAPIGKDTGVEMKQYICVNPACGLMYSGAMQESEIKKYARKQDAKRFNWIDFFMIGAKMLDEFIKSNSKKAKEAEKSDA